MKCPVCGYDPQKQYNYSLEIRKLMRELSPSIRKQIKHIITELNSGLPNNWILISTKEIFEFLKAIQNKSDTLITHAINSYVNSGALQDKKGLRYLKAIILNSEKVSDIQIQNEILKKGKSPQKLVKRVDK